MSNYDGPDPLGFYCPAGRTVRGVSAATDLDWITPCVEIPSGRHVLDFRGVGHGFGRLSFCRRHGDVFAGEVRQWIERRS